MDIKEKIGKTIILLRQNAGFTQEQFANETGIGRHYLSDIENGKRNISIDTICKISNFLNISLSDFFALVEKRNN